jgi:hypothetical protein
MKRRGWSFASEPTICCCANVSNLQNVWSGNKTFYKSLLLCLLRCCRRQVRLLVLVLQVLVLVLLLRRRILLLCLVEVSTLRQRSQTNRNVRVRVRLPVLHRCCLLALAMMIGHHPRTRALALHLHSCIRIPLVSRNRNHHQQSLWLTKKASPSKRFRVRGLSSLSLFRRHQQLSHTAPSTRAKMIQLSNTNSQSVRHLLLLLRILHKPLTRITLTLHSNGTTTNFLSRPSKHQPYLPTAHSLLPIDGPWILGYSIRARSSQQNLFPCCNRRILTRQQQSPRILLLRILPKPLTRITLRSTGNLLRHPPCME